MSEQLFNSIQRDEISLKEIIDFLMDSWKSFFVGGLLGLLASCAYLIVSPNQYQATAQIQMAQINASNNNNNNSNSNSNSNPLGVNIEEPGLLMARLKLPTTYSAEVIKACGFENTSSPAESLVSSAKFSVVKGVGSMIELRINRDSKENAINCAEALFESIKSSQNQIIKPYIEESKALLVKYEARLANFQALMSRVEKSGSALSAMYLANRDEVKFLTEEILRLNTFITTTDTRQAKLVSPIYAADAPVFPKKTISLIIGLIVGVFLGLLFVMGKKAFKTYKAA